MALSMQWSTVNLNSATASSSQLFLHLGELLRTVVLICYILTLASPLPPSEPCFLKSAMELFSLQLLLIRNPIPDQKNASERKKRCWNQCMSRSCAALEIKIFLVRKSLIGIVSISSRNSLDLFMGYEPSGRWTLRNLTLKMAALHKVPSWTPGKKNLPFLNDTRQKQRVCPHLQVVHYSHEDFKFLLIIDLRSFIPTSVWFWSAQIH